MTTTAIPYADAIETARRTAADFLRGLDPAERIVVFCHFDADGLGAGAVFGRGLPRFGFTDVVVVPSGRGESAFSDEARTRLRALEPAALIVTDLGVNALGVLPDVPTLFVDHHVPEGEPAGATIVLGYGWDPVPASAWLAYELLAPLADVSDLAWIAAVGAMSDLGDGAPWPGLADARKRWAAKWLREAVSLVNAARRSSAFDVETPLRILMAADHPRALAEADELGADRLRGYRAEVKAAMDEARKQAPKFSRSQPWALLNLDSPCQVHPLIAQQWRGRLPKFAVLAANRGYMPGIVAFSARTSAPGFSLPAMLRAAYDAGPENPGFGRGHDQASGAHLPTRQFNELLAALDFDPRWFAPE